MAEDAAGLIMAGGAGERMRRSGGTAPKPLVPIGGIPLLKWNLLALLRTGIRDLHVTVPAGADQVLSFAQGHCAELADRHGARLSIIEEVEPLGSIGAAANLADRGDIIVVNADNLTSLELQPLLSAHRASGAALTLAIHDEPLPIPYGQVATEDGSVVAYREKPFLTVQVCSAISVLSPIGASFIENGEPLGLPAFANRLLEAGAAVRSYHHAAPWIDVNDVAAQERAEVLLSRYTDQFIAVAAYA